MTNSSLPDEASILAGMPDEVLDAFERAMRVRNSDSMADLFKVVSRKFSSIRSRASIDSTRRAALADALAEAVRSGRAWKGDDCILSLEYAERLLAYLCADATP